MGIIGEILGGALFLITLIAIIATTFQGEHYDNHGAPKRDYLGELTVLMLVLVCVGLVLLRWGL